MLYRQIPSILKQILEERAMKKRGRVLTTNGHQYTLIPLKAEIGKAESRKLELAGSNYSGTRGKRNCGFNLPLAVYMPVDARNRIAAFLEAVAFFAPARSRRTSALTSKPFVNPAVVLTSIRRAASHKR